MDRYADSGDPRHLRRSRDLYVEAFEGAGDDYYTGINAAAKSVLLGDHEELEAASDYARRVQEIVGTEPTPGDYWATATVGEVFLIQGDYPNAGRLYEAAVVMTPEAVDSHASTWTQACRLMDKLQPGADDRTLVRQAFEHLDDCDD
jgi:ATP/maltotriose-dependent transcriptional regulator MalT